MAQANELRMTAAGDLQSLFAVGTAAGRSDAELLGRFAARGEGAEAAFAALVSRHGPMVLRACRGIARDGHDAEDAFQATFLVLARRAGSLWVRDSLGPWLHRVACRSATRACVEAQRRRMHEHGAAEAAARRGPGGSPGELVGLLQREVDRLPERYRSAIVLCDLGGRTHEEAARELGCPAGTVKSRLSRGRERLRSRLSRRGVALAVGMLGGTSADVPATLAAAASRVAVRYAAGGPMSGMVPASVTFLARGVMRMTMISRLKATGVAILGLGLGATVYAVSGAPDNPPAGAVPATPPAGPADPEVDTFTIAAPERGGYMEILIRDARGRKKRVIPHVNAKGRLSLAVTESTGKVPDALAGGIPDFGPPADEDWQPWHKFVCSEIRIVRTAPAPTRATARSTPAPARAVDGQQAPAVPATTLDGRPVRQADPGGLDHERRMDEMERKIDLIIELLRSRPTATDSKSDPIAPGGSSPASSSLPPSFDLSFPASSSLPAASGHVASGDPMLVFQAGTFW